MGVARVCRVWVGRVCRLGSCPRWGRNRRRGRPCIWDHEAHLFGSLTCLPASPLPPPPQILALTFLTRFVYVLRCTPISFLLQPRVVDMLRHCLNATSPGLKTVAIAVSSLVPETVFSELEPDFRAALVALTQVLPRTMKQVCKQWFS